MILDDIRSTTRDFVNDRVAPGAAERDRTEEPPVALLAAAGRLGMLGVTAPVELGGTDLGLPAACVVGEEVSRGCMSTATLVLGAYMVVDSILRAGSPEQAQRLVPGIVEGRTVACFAITEPEAGSDALGMRCRARPVAGGWVLDGSKTFITGGPVADLAIVYAVAEGGTARDGLGLFAIRCGTPGFTQGPPFSKMGWRASPTGELALDQVFVPDADVISAPGTGFRTLMTGLNSERLYLAAQALGVCRAAFALATEYATQRRQFGSRLADFQLIQAKLADMYIGIEALSAMLTAAIDAVATGPAPGRARLMSSAVKVFGADLAMQVCGEAVQILGGAGYLADHPAERFLRDAKILQIGGGTNEIQRLLLGKAITK